MNFSEERGRLIKWMRKQLIGPASMHGKLRGISPLDRYPTGRLFPIVLEEEGIDPASSVDEDDNDEFVAPGDDKSGVVAVESAIRRRRYIPPSSVGFSFFARGERVCFEVRCSAVRYKRAGDRDERGQFRGLEYERIVVGGDEEANSFTSTRRIDVLRVPEGACLAGIDVLWRPFLDGWIITVSLFNKQELDEKGTSKSISQERAEKSLFEVDLRCFMEAGEVGTYPRVDSSLLNKEEQELELQYKNRHIYAVGHGAAVNWRSEQGYIKEIYSEFMPAVEVPQVTADVRNDSPEVLGLAYLASSGDEVKGSFDELDQFVSGYATWVAGQQTKDFEPGEREAGERITNRMRVTVSRMQRGVNLLRSDRSAAKAFQLANQAMLDQMRQSDLVRGEVRDEDYYNWRPFQLAFLLTVIESSITDDDEFRDTVDLIWFPTGGGKTEAYLGLIAFLIVWRRLRHPASGGGTTALMRYTLRLLTAQQYQRATRMICALERIRWRTKELGDEPITVGMWVGSATSPNTFQKAQECVDQASEGKTAALRSLVLESCPWCGTRFKAPDNFIVSPAEFRFCCTNRECDFGRRDQGVIPCNVVDEALYKDPPTLLIATIDKFARLAWEERVGSFFGGTVSRPPELVIQDELHLIAGALGSVAGLYEAALDTVLIQKGVYPKYIASTATIRMAEQQVRRLYGRDLAVFPPPGLSCDDSYFARTVPLDDRPGRMYVGYLAPMLDRQHCMAPLVAALLVAPEAVFDSAEINRDDLLEAWWTQVVYHGSLKGVGNSHNAFNIDVREIFRRMALEADEVHPKTEEFELAERSIARSSPRIAQLTSISSAEDNARTFSRLEIKRDEPECLDAVLATNMVSVGLDVSRLALMVVNGQPLTTAEYIQASSRVGRSKVPGLVFTNYYRDQARSLSHYENFRPYHDSFYRFVEPTSVTPFTYQARTRALHAALVIAVRHSCSYLLDNNQAGNFNPSDDGVQKVIETLKRRCALADPDRTKEIEVHIDRLVDQWRIEAAHCHSSKRQLNYQAPDKDKATDRLLYNHDDRIKGLWPTLQSMRNVENTALLKPL